MSTKFLGSFGFLNLTQFFTALNDNYYKLLLIFFLIDLKGAEHSNTILSLAGIIFVIPYLIFASVAGTLADRYSKRTIIYFTRLTEILTTALALLFFALKSAIGGYVVLFLMATHSSIFSPCKYGIIPEIVPQNRISKYNGILTATTYLAIILGTFLASFVTEVTHKNYVIAAVFCVVLALLGAASSLGIEKTAPQAGKKKVSPRFLNEILQALKHAKKVRYLLPTILFGAYFLFMGSYTQLNIIPFTLQSLHLSAVQGGYLFLMTAIGIGIGSFSVGYLSKKEVELGFIPLAAVGITLCFVGLYLFDSHFFVVVPLLILLGVFGGFYTVPIEAFVQTASPPNDRGQNVATANFLSFIGVIISSFLIAFFGNVLNLNAAQGFLIVGLLTFIMGIFLFLLYADQVLRLMVAVFVKMFWRIRVVGKHRIEQLQTPLLLVAPRASWIDTIIVMSTLPRLIRYIVPTQVPKKRRSFFYRLLRIIPIDIEHFSPIGNKTLEVIKKEIKSGHSVCLMQPIDIPYKTLKDWESNLSTLLHDIGVPIMPIYVSREIPPKGTDKDLIVKVYYGKLSH